MSAWLTACDAQTHNQFQALGGLGTLPVDIEKVETIVNQGGSSATESDRN